jgi:ribosomal protein L11 methyltransferase
MSDEPLARFPRVVVDVACELADEVSFGFFELGASGVEVRDGMTLDRASVDGTVTLLASFATDQEADRVCGELDPGWNPRRDDVLGDAWRDGWKEHFRPFSLTPSILIRPPWVEVQDADDMHVLVMDPGRAFGTGLHATTRLVAQSIERNGVDGLEVLDVGCGSGVLALCALALGARRVRAVDNDPEAVSATLENAQRNGFVSHVDADTTDVGEIERSYPFVVANIETRVLIPMAEGLKRRVECGGTLVLSGILRDQASDVLEAYQPFVCIGRFEDSGWIALEFRAER